MGLRVVGEEGRKGDGRAGATAVRVVAGRENVADVSKGCFAGGGGEKYCLLGNNGAPLTRAMARERISWAGILRGDSSSFAGYCFVRGSAVPGFDTSGECMESHLLGESGRRGILVMG